LTGVKVSDQANPVHPEAEALRTNCPSTSSTSPAFRNSDTTTASRAVQRLADADSAAGLREGYVQGIATFHPGSAALLAGVHPIFKVHPALGFTIFLLFPFTRLVHVWSGFATLAYIVRPYQVVRTR